MSDSNKNVPIEVLYFLRDGINRSLDQCLLIKNPLNGPTEIYFEMIENSIRFIEESDKSYSIESLRDKLDVLKDRYQNNSILAN